MFKPQRINILIEEKKDRTKGLTNAIMAQEMGVGLDTLNKIKDGRNAPTVTTMEKIAVYFGHDMNYFFDNEIIIKDKQKDQLMVNDKIPEYKRDESSRNPWELLYDAQTKIQELTEQLMEQKIKNERLLNSGAPAQSATAV